jgi:AcrR family transcriptional regulator
MAARRPPTRRPRRTQAERSQATRAELVAAARKLFAVRGFAGTSLDEILAACGVTKGALYHHFATKTDLFRAVVEAEEQRLTALITEAARMTRTATGALHAGCDAFLQACLDPQLQRILLLDGPAVLGPQAMRDLEGRYTRALLQRGIEEALAEVSAPRRPSEAATHLLIGALSSGAVAIAQAPNPPAMLRLMKSEVARLLAALTHSASSR